MKIRNISRGHKGVHDPGFGISHHGGRGLPSVDQGAEAALVLDADRKAEIGWRHRRLAVKSGSQPGSMAEICRDPAIRFGQQSGMDFGTEDPTVGIPGIACGQSTSLDQERLQQFLGHGDFPCGTVKGMQAAFGLHLTQNGLARADWPVPV